MKILTKKKAEALFDDIMTLHLIASESNRMLMMNEKPDVKALLRTTRIITERCADAAYTLKGIFGIKVAQEIYTQYNEARMKKMVDEEAKKDTLDEIEKEGEQ